MLTNCRDRFVEAPLASLLATKKTGNKKTGDLGVILRDKRAGEVSKERIWGV